MGLRINAGYIITDSVHVGDAEFVLGVSQHISNDFVTWRCFNDNYYWGHYYCNLFSAQKDLVERAAERVAEIQDVLNAKEVMEPGYSPWGKVQSCNTLCDGVFSVNTESHGGIMVHQIVAGNVLSGTAKTVFHRGPEKHCPPCSYTGRKRSGVTRKKERNRWVLSDPLHFPGTE